MEKYRAYRKAFVAGTATAAAMHYVTSVYLHRSKTHGSIKFKPRVEMTARATTWLLTGIKPRQWVGVHLAHHANEDQPGDPHSPVQSGRFGVAKILFGNVLSYRNKARELQPHEYPKDMARDTWDSRLFDKSLLGQAALLGIFTAINKGNVKKGVASLGTTRLAYGLLSLISNDVGAVGTGGAVNALGHRGMDPFPLYLFRRPRPDQDGNYTRNLPLAPLLGILTAGEAWHDNHHQNPSSPVFHPNPWYDPGGAVAKGMISLGLATPGSGPPQLPLPPSTISSSFGS